MWLNKLFRVCNAMEELLNINNGLEMTKRLNLPLITTSEHDIQIERARIKHKRSHRISHEVVNEIFLYKGDGPSYDCCYK